jgi:hypothetical protein
VIGLAKEDLRRTEQDALDELIGMWEGGRLDLVTSYVTREEIHYIPEPARARHEALFARIEGIPVMEFIVRLMPQLVMTNAPPTHSRPVGPLPVPAPDDDLTTLRGLLPDEADARHLFQAIKSGCDYFVTDDARSIVSRATEIESRYPIKIRLPSRLVTELDG